STSLRTSRATAAGSALSFRSSDGTMPPCCSTSVSSRCSGVISAWLRSPARLWAATSASWAFSVSFIVLMSLSRLLRRRFGRAQAGQRLVVFLRLRRQRRRQLRIHLRVEVPLLVAAHRRHAVSLQPEDLPVLGQLRHAQPRGAAVEGRYVYLTAQNGGC